MRGSASARMIVVLLVAPLAGCVESGSFQTIEDAGWIAGHTFTLERHATMQVDATLREDGRIVEDERQTLDVVERHQLTVTVLSTQLVQDGVAYYVVQVDRPPTQTLEAVRQSDLQRAPLWIEPATGCATCMPIVRVSEPSGHPMLRFPLVAGDTWTTASEGLSASAKVAGPDQVTTPFGLLETIRIDHDLDDQVLEEQADEMEAAARSEGIEAKVRIEASGEAHWAADAHALASSTFRTELRTDATWRDSGSDYEGEATAVVEATERLVEVGRTSQPDLDMQAIRALLQEVPEPPAVPPTPEPNPEASRLTLSIEGPDVIILGDDAVYAARISQSGSAQQGPFEVRWQGLLPDGTVAWEATGVEAAWRPQDVAFHLITATAMQDGDPVAWAAHVTGTYAIGGGDLECPLVTLPEGCAPLQFDVGAWAGHVAAGAAATDNGVQGAALVVTDPDGASAEVPFDGQQAYFETDPAGWARGTWSLSYEDGIELMPKAYAEWLVLPVEALADPSPPQLDQDDGYRGMEDVRLFGAAPWILPTEALPWLPWIPVGPSGADFPAWPAARPGAEPPST